MTILDLSSGQVETDGNYGVFRATKEIAERFDGREKWLPLYEYETEEIISDLLIIRNEEDANPRRLVK